jgi:exopolyphosphatase/guanosine-5'-triphosphate,3'-diphosphate pyrophosphatase
VANGVAAPTLDSTGREALLTEKSKRRVTRRPRRKPKNPSHAGSQAAQRGQPYAALDLGTNNCRLLVAVPQGPGRFRVVDAFSRIVRLGEGLGASGRLSDEAMDRSIDALRACAAKLAQRPVRGMRLIATEACRSAQNGPQFLQRVHEEIGLELETINRETEARLAVAGCSSLVDPETRGVVLFDIGGGSSELALIDLARAKRNRAGMSDYTSAIAKWTSLPVGVVTLSERHGGGRNVTPPVFQAMVDEVSNMLADFDDDDVLGRAITSGDVHLLGTSGTVTTLAGIHLGLPKYDRRRVDGMWMSVKQMSRIVTELSEMSYDERQQNPCIGRDRADLVLAGCAILMAIKQRWPCERLRVADRGLREGLLTQMMDADNAWLPDRPHRHQKGRR